MSVPRARTPAALEAHLSQWQTEAYEALGIHVADTDPVGSVLESMAIDCEVLHLAMTNKDCDAFRINNFVLRLERKLYFARELHDAERAAEVKS